MLSTYHVIYVIQILRIMSILWRIGDHALGIMSNQPIDCYFDSCLSSAIKISLLYQHVGLFTQHAALWIPL